MRILKLLKFFLPLNQFLLRNSLESVFCSLFQKIDQNKDSQVSKTELSAFMLGIQTEQAGLSTGDLSDAVMKNFDVSHDEAISESEFVLGIAKWLDEDMNSTANGLAKSHQSSSASSKTTSNKLQVRQLHYRKP